MTTCSVEPIHTGSSKVDIFLELFETPQGSVVGHIEYDSSLWQRSSIQAMAAAFSVSLSCLQCRQLCYFLMPLPVYCFQCETLSCLKVLYRLSV